jgi:hypothetical protein
MWTLARLILLFLLVTDLIPHAVGAGDQKFGSLRLCPAGGRPFQMAWNLACDMKKRKRREVEKVVFGSDHAETRTNATPIQQIQEETEFVKRDQYRPATLSDIMQICCEVGCEIRDLLAYCDPFGSWNS